MTRAVFLMLILVNQRGANKEFDNRAEYELSGRLRLDASRGRLNVRYVCGDKI